MSNTTVSTNTQVDKVFTAHSGVRPIYSVPVGSPLLAERIRKVAEDSGLSQRAFSLKAGLGETHVNTILQRLKANPEAEVEQGTLVAIAKAGGVTVAWLTGEAESASPAPPPATGPRAKPRADHHFPEEVEDIARKFEEHPEAKCFTWSQKNASKVFLRDSKAQFRPGTNLVAYFHNVLKVAKALDDTGEEPSYEAILAAFISQDPTSPPEGETPLQRKMREARERRGLTPRAEQSDDTTPPNRRKRG